MSDFDPMRDIDQWRTVRDLLFDGVVAVDRGERLRVIDCDASATLILDALRAEPSRSSPDPDLPCLLDCDCHFDPELDHGSCDYCTGKSEQERSRLGSSPDLTGLDPERLATVLHARRPGHLLSGACDDCRRDARAIAAEYARLSPAPETDPSQVER